MQLYGLAYSGCVSCFSCKRKGRTEVGVCALKDDLSQVLERVREADALVLGTPVYYGAETSGMRAFIERLLREHEEAYVRHVLAKIQDYTDRQVEAGKKVNVSAFTVAAFKNEYFPLSQDVPGALQEAEGKTSAAARTRRKEERLSLLDNTEKQRDKDQADTSAWKALYGSLPQERQQELAMAFEEGVVGNGLLLRPWMKEGLKSDLVWGRFKAFLADSGLVV